MINEKAKAVWARARALAKAHPRRALGALGASAVAVVAVGWIVLNADTSLVHLPKPRGVRPIVLNIPEGALPPGAPIPTVPKYDPAYAHTQSAALEPVRDERGRLTRLFREVRDCSSKPCVKRIVVKADGRVAFDGARWADGYIPTGRGKEVVRLRPKASKT